MSNLIEKETAVLMVNVAERYIVEKGLTVNQGMTWLRDHIHDAEAGGKLVPEPVSQESINAEVCAANARIAEADQGRTIYPAQFVDYAEIAKRVRKVARQCIASARSQGGYYKHRGIELIAVDKDGERAGQGGEPVEFFEVDTISGKAIREALEHHAPEDMVTWCLQGGIDAYDSFQDAMQYPDDYEPMVDTWEVEPAPVAERGAPRQRAQS